jgi:NinB protein
MPITIVLVDEKQRAQATRAIETAVPRTRIVILDPALSDQQLKLLRILAADLLEQATPKIQLTMSELERLLTAGMFCDQGAPGFEPGTWVVRGIQFEELTVAQASDCAEYVYSYGAQRGIIFREKKPT